MYFVYILHSEKFDKYYIGQTNAPRERLIRHNEFEVTSSYTSKYRPWVLKTYVETGEKRSDAMRVEKGLKALKSKKMIAQFAKNPDKLMEFVQKVLSSGI